MAERVLWVASDLAVRVCAPMHDWLQALELQDAPDHACRALLRVRPAGSKQWWEPPPENEAMFWANVAWDSNGEAAVQLPGGEGRARLEPTGAPAVELDVALDSAAPDRALSSAVRLSLALLLSLRGDYLFHASAALIQGQAVLFLGSSGAGKTTTARRVEEEGAIRLADDLTLVRRVQGVWVAEACLFDDPAGQSRLAKVWPLRAAYLVQKGAAATRCGPAAERRPAHWASAVFMPRPHPSTAISFLDGLAQLARHVPLRTLHAAPGGPLMPTLLADLAAQAKRNP